MTGKGWVWTAQRTGRYTYGKVLAYITNPDHTVPGTPSLTDVPTVEIGPRHRRDDGPRTSSDSTYWLSTWCKGDPSPALAILKPLVTISAYKLLTCIRPTDWITSKLEAIDLSQPFRWYDDEPLQFEIQELAECGLLDSWIKVDLHAEPNQLLKLA
jgi:hypothetical protein